MDEHQPMTPQDGRGAGWRMGMLTGAALLAGAGYAVLRWPQIIVYCVAAAAFGLAGFLAISALLARGRHG